MQHNLKPLWIPATESQNKLDLLENQTMLEIRDVKGSDNRNMVRIPSLSWQGSCHAKSKRTLFMYDFDEHIQKMHAYRVSTGVSIHFVGLHSE